MTGANRLLIGVGWSVVALITVRVMRRRASGSGVPAARAVQLRPVQVVEVAFLAIASIYALTLALRPSLTWIDAVVLFAIFAAYLWRVRSASRPGDGGEDAEHEDEDEDASELFGPASRVAALSKAPRRGLTIFMLVAAATIIVLVAEPFADSLVETGSALHVDKFLLVQWVAPLASETPEFIAVILLAMKLQGASALGALISSKINQWTLLVGILPLVFAVSSGSLSGLPVDVEQREELLLTAAQSVFAIALILPGRLTSRGAWTLLTLFLAQFLAAWLLPADLRGAERLWFSGAYLVLAVLLVVRHRSALHRVFVTGLRRPPAPARPEGDA
jgi:cation:H+ antiporter